MNKFHTRYYRVFNFNVEITYRPKWLEDMLHEMYLAIDDRTPSIAKTMIEVAADVLGTDHPDIAKACVLLRLAEFKRTTAAAKEQSEWDYYKDAM